MNDPDFRNQVHRAVDQMTKTAKEDPWLAQRIRAQVKGEEPVKKRLSVGTVLVLVILLLSVSVGIATVSGWDVVQFLYGDRNIPMPEVDVFPVHQEVSSGGALFRVESAVYDGKYLAFDWHFENTEPETPICGYIQRFTANGVPISGDGGDSFEYLWLPGRYIEENYWEDGEKLVLPKELQDAESLHISLKIKVYRPTGPVYEMEKFDPEEAGTKIEEGYFVIPEEEGFVEYDPDEGQWAVFYGSENSNGRLQETFLEMSFDIPKGENADYILESRTDYESEHGSVSYDVAAIMDGLHLTLRMVPKDDAFSRMQELVLTDGDGTPLKGDRFTPDVCYRVDTGEPGILVYRYRWSRVRQKDLPDTISLTCILEDGEKLIFPVKVR